MSCAKSLASLDGTPQKGSHPALRLQLRPLAAQAFLLLLARQLRYHRRDGLDPTREELSGIESGGRLLAKDALFNNDHVEPLPYCCFRGAQPGKAAARDQQLAGEVLGRAGRRRKGPHVLIICQGPDQV